MLKLCSLAGIILALLAACTSDSAPAPSLALFAGSTETTALPTISRFFGDGVGPDARFVRLRSVTTDTSGNLYLVDGIEVRKITPNAQVSSVHSDGFQAAITSDRANNLYVATNWLSSIHEFGDTILVKITTGGTFLASIANYGSELSFWGIASAGDANLYATFAVLTPGGGQPSTEEPSNAIWRIDAAGERTAVAGAVDAGFADGSATAARFSCPTGIATDATGNVYIVDRRNRAIRKMTPQGGVTTIARIPLALGDDCFPSDGNAREGLAIAPEGTVYMADGTNNVVWRIGRNGTVTMAVTKADLQTFAGAGLSTYPSAVAVVGSDLFFTLETVVLVLRNRP